MLCLEFRLAFEIVFTKFWDDLNGRSLLLIQIWSNNFVLMNFKNFNRTSFMIPENQTIQETAGLNMVTSLKLYMSNFQVTSVFVFLRSGKLGP